MPVLILWLTFGLRLTVTQGRDLWLDEAVETSVANRPLAEVIAADQANTHDPPLYSVLLNLWMRIGMTDRWLQMLSIAFSVLAVAALLTLGRQVFSQATGWVAGSIAAVAPRAVFFGQEVNQYGLVLLLSVLALLLLERYFRSPGRRRLMAFAGVCLAAILTHYEMAIFTATLVMAGTLQHLLPGRTRARRLLVAWFVALGVIGLVGVTLLIAYALPQKARLPATFAPAYFFLSPPLTTVIKLGVQQTIEVLHFIFWGTEQPGPDWLTGALLLIGSVLTLRHERGRWFPTYLLGGLFIGFLASGIGFLVFVTRYVWYAFPLAVMLIAAALTLAPRPQWQPAWRIGGVGIAGALGVLLLVRLPSISGVPFAETERLGEVVKYVEAQRQPGDVVYVYYGARHQFIRYASDDLKQIATIETWARGKPIEVRTSNLWLVAEGQRAWLLMSHVHQNEGRDLTEFLAARCKPLSRIEPIGAMGYLFDCR